MLATSANGHPAAAVYSRDRNGQLRPYGICVLMVTSAGIRRVSSFGDARPDSRIRVPGGRPGVRDVTWRAEAGRTFLAAPGPGAAARKLPVITIASDH